MLTAIGGLNRGGSETWLLNVVRRIPRSRFQMDVLVDSDRPYAYGRDFLEAGCRILPCPGYREPWVYLRNFRRLYAQSGPYDILHSHVHYYSGIVLTIGRLLGVPVRIAHVHPAQDLKPPSWKRTVYRESMFALLRSSATHLLTPSQTSLQAAVAQTGYRVSCRKVVYNGIDLSRFEKKVDRPQVRRRLGLPTGIPLVCYVARFAPNKNHRQILRIADRMNRSGKAAHFVFAGSHGSEMDYLAQASTPRTDVSMLIGLEDVTELLMASDVFLFPSLEEGFGIVALEAQAAGLPVVASNLATIREACAPSHRELMFEPDHDDALISQLRRVIESPTLRERLAEDGRRWVRGFSVDASVASLIEVYDSALGVAPLDGAVA